MNCFACKNLNCKRIKSNYDTVVIQAPLFNDNTIMLKGVYNMYDQTVSIKYNSIDYTFYANNLKYMKHRLRQINQEHLKNIFIYNGIAKVECCNERSITTLNNTYLRLFVKASSFYSKKSRKIEDITPSIIKIPVSYEQRMEKWYNDMDALRSMLLNRV